MEKILIGTTNKGKFAEIKEVLGSLPFKLLMPSDLKINGMPNESGSTYEENAIIKAKFYTQKSGLLCIAEDSGIEIIALPGELGHLTRRWGKGEKASDEEWLDHFLKIMERQKNRKAVFKCVAAISDRKNIQTFKGECHGTIILKPQVKPPRGIPISSVFIPEGSTKVYAALTPEEKNRISHRGRAIHQIIEPLKAIFRDSQFGDTPSSATATVSHAGQR